MLRVVPALLLFLICLIAPGSPSEGQDVESPAPAAPAAPADTAFARFLDGLDDPDRGVRFAAAQALGKCGDPAIIPALARAMADPEWCVREVAAHSLRTFGEKSAPIFAEALGSDDPGRRMAATKVFARWGEPGLPFVRRALSDPDERIRFFAAQILADDSVVPVLRGLLGSKDTSIGIEAARMLTDFGHGKDAIETLLAGIREYRGVSRVEVAGILQRSGACGPEEAKALVEIVLKTKKGNYRLRSAVVEVLVSIGLPAETALEWGLHKDHWNPWGSALNTALLRIRGQWPPKKPDRPSSPPPTREELLARLSDPDIDAWDRRFAAECLAEDPGTRGQLLGLLGHDLAAEHAFDALLAMEGGLPATEQEALELLRSPGPAGRRLGIRALRALGILEPVRALIEDPDEGVKACARWALEPAKPKPPPEAPPLPPVPVLVERLSDPDLAVSLLASEVLPRHGEAAAGPLAKAMATGHYGVLHYAEWIFMQLGPSGAPATDSLIALLGHEDVNVREVTARCLGEIGPRAEAAVPALVLALRDIRISVRGRAAVALGRIGEAAAPALLEAAGDADARVRASAVFALGWIVGERNGIRQVAFDIRLPVVEPGPASETGFRPTDAQVEQALSLANAKGGKEVIGLLEDLPDNERVAILRAGLRTGDVRAAVACAAALDMEHLDAWEAERCVELLLPEVFRPDPPTSFHRVYEYLGSSEVAAMLGYLALSDISDYDRRGVLGACHRIVRWDLLPELYRIEKTQDQWVIEDSSSIWFCRFWSNRYQDQSGSASSGPGLPDALRKSLEWGPPSSEVTMGRLNDSVPSARDAPVLIGYVRALRERGGSWHELLALLRALGHLDDRESEELLLTLFVEQGEDGNFARSALARRGDPAALRRLREDAVTDCIALSLLLEVRPDLGAREFLRQLLEGDSGAACWEVLPPDEEIRQHGFRWPDGLFDGVEAAALASDSGPTRLARIALVVPGCRTGRMADAILAALPAAATDLFVGYDDFDPDREAELHWPEPNRLFAFLHSARPVGVLRLLRSWARGEEEKPRRFALGALLRIGDVESAELLVEWVRGGPVVGGYDEPVAWTLSRSPTTEVEEFLRSAVRDPALDPELKAEAVRDLATLYGLPPDARSWIVLEHLDESLRTRFAERVLEKRPVEGVIELFREAQDGDPLDPETLGSLAGSEEARKLLRQYMRNRSLSCPTVLGELARLGDEAARRELWSGIRAGRYRWICYETEHSGLTLGWDPATYPALLDELQTNCCRAGYVASMFEQRMGDRTVNYEPHGQDALPVKEARDRLRFYGGRVMTPFGDERCVWTEWIPAPGK